MDFEALREAAREAVEKAGDMQALEAVRAKYLGRTDGEVTKILRSLKELPISERRIVGQKANEAQKVLEEAVSHRREELLRGRERRGIDFTKPGKRAVLGHLHPLTETEREIRRVFSALNFSVVEGPEVEDEYHNFDALNVPADHPAREMWDTFWLHENEIKNQPKVKKSGRMLLRTHTSPMQVRYMETHEPPFQIIVPGRVFRYEATDASHEVNFYQVEGLMIGEDVSLAHYKFIISHFLNTFFGRKIEFRFRPSYFPFTEPSVEVDIRWGKKWLEVMGAGMVHPNVFRAVGYDSRRVQGFAFGMGMDRLLMLKYGVPDIRMLYSGDLRVVRQF